MCGNDHVVILTPLFQDLLSPGFGGERLKNFGKLRSQIGIPADRFALPANLISKFVLGTETSFIFAAVFILASVLAFARVCCGMDDGRWF